VRALSGDRHIRHIQRLGINFTIHRVGEQFENALVLTLAGVSTTSFVFAPSRALS